MPVRPSPVMKELTDGFHHRASELALFPADPPHAGAALVAPASLLPAIAAAAEQAPDPHVAWHTEWRELLHWSNTADTGGRDLAEFPQWDRLTQLEGLIALTPARTLAGVRVQLALLHHVVTEVGVPNEDDVTGLENALATVERLAGEARHV
jgi:hypothetical protein